VANGAPEILANADDLHTAAAGRNGSHGGVVLGRSVADVEDITVNNARDAK
jgi:hypothetical protein